MTKRISKENEDKFFHKTV